MKIKILEVSTDELIDAIIREGKSGELPSMQENWRFNFEKQLRKLKHATAFILVTEETPSVIEGCLIFQMIDKVMPYIALVEVAPHNCGDNRKFDHVAGCLIAFSFKQTFVKADEAYKGMLFLDVLEQNEEVTRKLMSNYHKKYNAKIWEGTKMVIMDENGDALVEKYLG